MRKRFFLYFVVFFVLVSVVKTQAPNDLVRVQYGKDGSSVVIIRSAKQGIADTIIEATIHATIARFLDDKTAWVKNNEAKKGKGSAV